MAVYADVKEAVRAVKLWLEKSSVWEDTCETNALGALHRSGSSVGERALRKLWVEVLFLHTRQTVLSYRALQGYVLKTSIETRRGNKKRNCYLLFS